LIQTVSGSLGTFGAPRAGCDGWREGSHAVEGLVAPTSVSINSPAYDSDGNFAVTWSASGTVTAYTLERRLGFGSWSTIYTGTSTSYAETGRSEGTWRYRIEACNQSACAAKKTDKTIVDYNMSFLAPEPVAIDPAYVAGASHPEPQAPALDARTAPPRGSAGLASTPAPGPAQTVAPAPSRRSAGLAPDAAGAVTAAARQGRQTGPPSPMHHVVAAGHRTPPQLMVPGSPRVAGLVSPVAAAVQQALTATGGDSSGYRFTVKYLYDGVGALVALVDPVDNDVVYWRAHATDAAGRVNLESMGNGINTARVFDQATGLLEGISTGYGASSAIQTLTYAWDGMGNLSERYDDNQDLTETFVYDALNRLDYSQLDTGAGAATNLDLTYDAAGNVTAKAMPLTQDGSTNWSYTYGGSQPHAVTSVSGTGSYTYDDNGNQVTGPNGREIDWTAFNKPWRIEEGSSEHLFLYGPDRGRYKQIVNVSSTWQSTTVTIGGLYERVTRSSGNEHRMHLMAGSGVVATVVADQSSGDFAINYFHRDHLGSVSAITDGNGDLVVELSYDAHGMRRDPTDWMGPAPAGDVEDANAIVRYGFTGQEQLDAVNLVHMNGRVQDPVIGRMISADNIIPGSLDSQSFNRYSYVTNRVLTFNDPTGHGPARNGTANGRTWNYAQDGIRSAVPSQEEFERKRQEVMEPLSNQIAEFQEQLQQQAIEDAVTNLNAAAIEFNATDPTPEQLLAWVAFNVQPIADQLGIQLEFFIATVDTSFDIVQIDQIAVNTTGEVGVASLSGMYSGSFGYYVADPNGGSSWGGGQGFAAQGDFNFGASGFCVGALW